MRNIIKISKSLKVIFKAIPYWRKTILDSLVLCSIVTFGCAHSHSILDQDDPSTSIVEAIKTKVYVEKIDLKVDTKMEGFPAPKESWLDLENEVYQSNRNATLKRWKRLRMNISYSRDELRDFFGSYGNIAVQINPVEVDARKAGCFKGDTAYVHLIGFQSDKLEDIPQNGTLTVQAKLSHYSDWVIVQQIEFRIGETNISKR